MNKIVKKENVRKELIWVLNNKTKSDIVIFINREYDKMMYLNKEELSQEMKNWRKLRKDNIICIDLDNNLKVFVEEKPYYILTLSIVADNEDNNVGCDNLSMFGFDTHSILVTGYTYLFTRENNRDMVYKYVMGLK